MNSTGWIDSGQHGGSTYREEKIQLPAADLDCIQPTWGLSATPRRAGEQGDIDSAPLCNGVRMIRGDQIVCI